MTINTIQSKSGTTATHSPVLPPCGHTAKSTAVKPHPGEFPKSPKHLLWKNHTAHMRSFCLAVLPATKARYYRSRRKSTLQRHLLWKITTAIYLAVQPARGTTATSPAVLPLHLNAQKPQNKALSSGPSDLDRTPQENQRGQGLTVIPQLTSGHTAHR